MYFLANKKGDKYECEDCGLVILVEEPCGCEQTEIVCCGEPMKAVKAGKARKKQNLKQLQKQSK